VNQETKPFLVKLSSFEQKTTSEEKLQELFHKFRELELRVSRLERQFEKFNQERKQ
jgi:translation initiation factor IF-2